MVTALKTRSGHVGSMFHTVYVTAASCPPCELEYSVYFDNFIDIFEAIFVPP
jgi:hypothetical protein